MDDFNQQVKRVRARWLIFAVGLLVIVGAVWWFMRQPATAREGSESSGNLAPAQVAPATINLLMIGNSHTGSVSQLVKQVLENETGESVRLKTFFVGHLDQDVSQAELLDAVKDPSNEIVVLQAQQISSSHQINYSTDSAETLARAAIARGAKLFFFSEWKRKGIEETKYYEDIYQGIATRAGGEVIPVGRVFDAVLTKYPELDVWMADGNHANAIGSEIAAIAIASWVHGDVKKSVADSKLSPEVFAAAQSGVAQNRDSLTAR